MTASSGGQDGDFETLARQYWNAWGEALRQGGSGAGAGPAQAAPDWRQALSWWSQLMPEDASADARAAVDRFGAQAGDWLGTMQQVAARFAGRDASSEEVATAWREAVREQGDHLLQWTLGALRGGAGSGFDPWLQQAVQALQQWQRGSAPWLEMPAFGLGRNHHSRWQALVRAQQEYQAHSQAYVEQLKAALERAFDLFERKLGEHESPGSQLTSARAMFDLWIEAAEEAYAAVALSEEFREAYGAFANAHMRLRAALQREAEQVAGQLGMPTRSEMDAAHRRIAELERMVRRMAAAREDTAGPARPRPAKARPSAAKRATAKDGKAAAAAKRPRRTPR